MKKQLNEVRRMQVLAGLITKSFNLPENQETSLDPNKVKQILNDNGVDDDYFESMAGVNNKEIEAGSEEWMGILSDITGKDAYGDEFSEEDERKIKNLKIILKNMKIKIV